MDKKEESYTLFVDGKAKASDIPEAEMGRLMKKYGVDSEQTLSLLLQGVEERVWGQDLRLVSASKSARNQAARAPYDDVLNSLSVRSEYLNSKAIQAGGTAAVAAVIGGILYFSGVLTEPSVHIYAISVPPDIESAFSNSAFPGAAEQIKQFFEGSVFRGIAIGTAMVGGLLGIMSGALERMIPPLMIALSPLAVPVVIDATFPDPEKSAFHEAVTTKDVPALELALSRAGISSIDATYVLAQAAIANDGPEKWVIQAAQNLKESNYSFEVDPDVAHVIEMAAAGNDSASLSEASRQHVDSIETTAGMLKTGGAVMFVAAGLIGLLGAGKAGLAAIINRRVRRINKLLEHS